MLNIFRSSDVAGGCKRNRKFKKWVRGFVGVLRRVTDARAGRLRGGPRDSWQVTTHAYMCKTTKYGKLKTKINNVIVQVTWDDDKVAGY